jgi:protein PhnA
MSHEDDEPEVKTKDSNGTLLASGDSIQAIKDLKVKGTSFIIKRGTIIRGIYLTDDEKIVQGNSDKLKNLLLEVQYFKKV